MNSLAAPDWVKTPFTTISPVEPINLPPETVKPPLKVCCALPAIYVPFAKTVARPATVVVWLFAEYVPEATVNVPAIVLAEVPAVKVALSIR